MKIINVIQVSIFISLISLYALLSLVSCNRNQVKQKLIQVEVEPALNSVVEEIHTDTLKTVTTTFDTVANEETVVYKQDIVKTTVVKRKRKPEVVETTPCSTITKDTVIEPVKEIVPVAKVEPPKKKSLPISYLIYMLILLIFIIILKYYLQYRKRRKYE